MRMPLVTISRCCHVSAVGLLEILFSLSIAIHDCAFYLLDQVGHRDTTRAGIGTVEDRTTTPDAGTLSQNAKAFRGALVATVEDEAMCVHNRGWPNQVGMARNDRPRTRTGTLQINLLPLVVLARLTGILQTFVS